MGEYGFLDPDDEPRDEPPRDEPPPDPEPYSWRGRVDDCIDALLEEVDMLRARIERLERKVGPDDDYK